MTESQLQSIKFLRNALGRCVQENIRKEILALILAAEMSQIRE